MFKRLKVSHGLFSVLIILTLLQIISSCWNIYNYSQNSAKMRDIATNYMRVNALNEAYNTVSEIRGQVWKLSFLMSNGVDYQDSARQIHALKSKYVVADEHMKRFLALSAQGTAEDVKDAEAMKQHYDAAKALQLQNLTKLEQRKFADMAHFSSKNNPTQDLLERIEVANENINQKVITPAIQASQTTVHNAIIQSVIVVALCVLFTVCAIVWSRKYVVNKISQLMVYQASIARGDLSVPVHVDGTNEIDNLAKGLADMQDSLSEMIRSVRTSSGNIYTSVREIALGNNDLSSRTEEQASALEQTAASMEQLTSAVKNNTENARQVAKMAANSEEMAHHGGELTQKMVETMGLITQSSHKISEIIGVIDGIAFQTNILALNAAVEAARAGTHGQGFAVVASEVRSLALRSAEAAKEIKALIDTSVSHVQAGNTLTGEVDQSIRKMMDSAANAKVTLEEIFRASEEQSRGIEQVSQAISEMDTVTQQNAALVEQSAAASGSLEDQVKRLNQIVAFFKVGQEDQANTDLHAVQGNASLEYRA